jgi:hypothetical protein
MSAVLSSGSATLFAVGFLAFIIVYIIIRMLTHRPDS